MPAIALQHDDAQRLVGQIVHRREHALDQRAVIGVVDLRAVQRDGRDPACIEVPENGTGRH